MWSSVTTYKQKRLPLPRKKESIWELMLKQIIMSHQVSFLCGVYSLAWDSLGRQSGGGEGLPQRLHLPGQLLWEVPQRQILVPPCWRAAGMSRGSGAPQYLKSWWGHSVSWVPLSWPGYSVSQGCAFQLARPPLLSVLLWCVGMSFDCLSVCVLIAQLSQLTGIGKETRKTHHWTASY